MDTSDAFSLLGVRPTCSRDELRRAFLHLVKRYHPDRGLADEQESNLRMSLINEAYRVAGAQLDDRDVVRSHAATAHPPPENRGAAPRWAREQFSRDVDATVETIEEYYTLGLENVHRRAEGSARLHFFRVQRALVGHSQSFDTLKPYVTGTSLDRPHKAFSRFVHRFVDVAAGPAPTQPAFSSREQQAFRAFREAAALVDQVILYHFTSRTKPGTTMRPPSEMLYTATAQLQIVLGTYGDTRYAPYAEAWFFLVDATVSLLAVAAKR